MLHVTAVSVKTEEKVYVNDVVKMLFKYMIIFCLFFTVTMECV